MRLPALVVSTLICFLLYLGSPASSDAESDSKVMVSVNMSLTGVSISITGASEDYAKTDDYQRLLEDVGRRARDAYFCGLMNRSSRCLEYSPPPPKKDCEGARFSFECDQGN